MTAMYSYKLFERVLEEHCNLTDDKEQKEASLNLITHVEVEPAHTSDANALIPAIESAKNQNLKPEELIADALYGSDNNCELAKEHDVELIAPTMGACAKDKLSLADFQFSEKGEIVACPRGNAPAKIRNKKRASIGFALDDCKP